MTGQGPRRYVPLLQLLAQLPPEQQAITLTFAELADLLGGPLPVSARAGMYWGNTGRLALRNWVPMGWQAQLTRYNQQVTFTRRRSS